MQYRASQSHRGNDVYMDRFNAAYKRLQSLSVREEQSKDSHIPSPTPKASSSRHQRTARSPAESSSSRSSKSSAASLTKTSAVEVDQWTGGIEDIPSVWLDLSDRLLLCCSMDDVASEIAVGSADHAVYVVDLSRRSLKRTLYTKASGHSEWVTCLTHTADGCVVSGGMDSKICLWRKTGVSCLELLGHAGSISGLTRVDSVVVSSSYDKSLKLWNGESGRDLGSLKGHRAPVLHLVSNPSGLVASGDRGGSVIVWNTTEGELLWRLKKIHKGHVTSIKWQPLNNDCFLTGGQDGMLRLWDRRDRSNIFKEKIHGDVNAAAAVNEILLHPSKPHFLATCGADRTFKVFDIRAGCCASLWKVDLSDFPYSARLHGNYAFCSCGDGSLMMIDVEKLDVVQNLLGATAAMQFIHIKNGQLLCGGDDGELLFYDLHRS